jgi:hypothetical protein
MKTWHYETIRGASTGTIAGQLCDWPEVAEALTANGIPLHPGVRMSSVREICRLILAERKTTDPYAKAGGAASTIQAMLLDREIYASLADIAECYRHYCEEFAASGWLELSYWDDTDDHIGPVDYIAARIGNGKPN